MKVQPGVVQDQLNQFLAPHGYLFGPDTSTSNRATIGGMTGNNSAGSRSVIYGKTVDHVIEIDAILSDGSRATFGPLEPEGLEDHTVYPNGISTSLPFDAQYAMVRSIRGFENAHITRPGYAIEYDYFDPRDLKPSLETRFVRGLFFAGQTGGR